MTEERTKKGQEPNNGGIGFCTDGGCDQPATVRVFEDFVLCTLHHLHYRMSAEIDDLSLALGLIKPWESQARMHRNEPILELFERAREDFAKRLAALESHTSEIDRAEEEIFDN